MHRMQRKIMANEASVFDINSLTRTMSAVLEAGTDNHAPISGGSSIITTQFLGGSAAGQHQDTVKSHDQTVHVSKSRRTIVAEDEELTINKNRETTVQGTETLTVKRSQIVNVTESSTLTAKKVEITGQEEVTIHVGGNCITINKDSITVYANKTVGITADVELILQGPGDNMIKLDATGVTIQGVLVKIN
jgi:hypothetical protein